MFAFLAASAPANELAWDCGTGNGQAAVALVRHFNHVVATDASQEQIGEALSHERIEYRVERAENVSIETATVDLITVATAVHWFDLEVFYVAAYRVLKPKGVLAVWVYHLPLIAPRLIACCRNTTRNCGAEILRKRRMSSIRGSLG